MQSPELWSGSEGNSYRCRLTVAVAGDARAGDDYLTEIAATRATRRRVFRVHIGPYASQDRGDHGGESR